MRQRRSSQPRPLELRELVLACVGHRGLVQLDLAREQVEDGSSAPHGEACRPVPPVVKPRVQMPARGLDPPVQRLEDRKGSKARQTCGGQQE